MANDPVSWGQRLACQGRCRVATRNSRIDFPEHLVMQKVVNNLGSQLSTLRKNSLARLFSMFIISDFLKGYVWPLQG